MDPAVVDQFVEDALVDLKGTLKEKKYEVDNITFLHRARKQANKRHGEIKSKWVRAIRELAAKKTPVTIGKCQASRAILTKAERLVYYLAAKNI